MKDKGFLTLADGTQRFKRGSFYLEMAKGLIRSIKNYDSNFPVAIVSDSKDKEITNIADLVIEPNTDYGCGTVQKLYIDYYSPFQETIFIEADCLLYAHPLLLWNKMKEHKYPVVIQSQGIKEFTEGGNNFSIKELTHYLKKCRIDKFAHTIGGLIYYNKSEQTKSIFNTTRSLYARRQELGLRHLKQQIPVADETIYATALAIHNIPTMPADNFYLQEEFRIIKRRGFKNINVLDTSSPLITLSNNKQNFIAHFSALDKNRFIYIRELQKLKLKAKMIPNLEYSKWNSMLIISLASFSAIPTYFVMKKRRVVYLVGMLWQRSKVMGIKGLMPNRIKRVFNCLFKS